MLCFIHLSEEISVWAYTLGAEGNVEVTFWEGVVRGVDDGEGSWAAGENFIWGDAYEWAVQVM
jgi:hypothetical protein